MAFYHKYKLTNRLWKRILLVFLAILVVARLALPYIALYYVNKNLANLEGYRGHLEDIDIHLWRGGIAVISLNW